MTKKVFILDLYKDACDGGNMLVGLMGDTHDNLPLIDKAVERLNQENVQLVLHTGDYVSGFVIPRFKALKAKLIGVFGNNDGDHENLRRKFAENERLEIQGSFAEIAVGNLRIALLHGREEILLKAIIESSYYGAVVHGHSHNAEVYRKGRTLVVNPGEVCGYLRNRTTIGLLDTDKCEAKIIEI